MVIKLFNASSSEIYKGHLDYLVEEDDTKIFHSHPYSIAKIMGHSMVDFYRKTYTPENIKTPNLLMNIPTLFSSVS